MQGTWTRSTAAAATTKLTIEQISPCIRWPRFRLALGPRSLGPRLDLVVVCGQTINNSNSIHNHNGQSIVICSQFAK